MRQRYWTMLCLTVLSNSALTGCSWTQRGAALGGLTGAGIGGVWAANAGNLSAAEGALVGLAAGGLAGALVGDQLDQKSARDLKREIGELQKELDARQRMVDEGKEALDALREKLADRERALRDLEDKIKELEKEIADLKKRLGDWGEEVKVRREGEKIVLTILGETLYASGKAKLTDHGKEVLDRVMRIVRERFPDREILVRGHTDIEPIKYSPWDDNWELGAQRALGVLRYLMEKHGVKGENISAAAYAYYRPVADNATAEGRRQNRRAEIVILPRREVSIERAE